LIEAVSNKNVSTSSSCSGIETGLISDTIVANTAAQFIAQFGDISMHKPVTFDALFAIEVDTKCQAELLNMGDAGPGHLFVDMLDFVADRKVRQQCGLKPPKHSRILPYIPATLVDPSVLRAKLPTCKIADSAWCLKHRRFCPLMRADIHRAGLDQEEVAGCVQGDGNNIGNTPGNMQLV